MFSERFPMSTSTPTPDEIIEFLVDSYKSIYPDYVSNWNGMMRTMAIARAPPTVIQNLLDLQEESFPEQTHDFPAKISKLNRIPSYSKIQELQVSEISVIIFKL